MPYAGKACCQDTISKGHSKTMRVTIAFAAGLLVAFGAAPAMAQQATKIGQHNAWGTYSYQAQSGKVCYLLTVPTDKKPPKLDHGDIFFFVSQRPADKTYQPQFIASYNLQENSKVNVTVDGKTFAMFVKGKSAWVEDSTQEPALIAAMKAGTTMSVAAKSGRGNPTNYAFSLKGISAALTSIQQCK